MLFLGLESCKIYFIYIYIRFEHSCHHPLSKDIVYLCTSASAGWKLFSCMDLFIFITIYQFNLLPQNLSLFSSHGLYKLIRKFKIFTLVYHIQNCKATCNSPVIWHHVRIIETVDVGLSGCNAVWACRQIQRFGRTYDLHLHGIYVQSTER